MLSDEEESQKHPLWIQSFMAMSPLSPLYLLYLGLCTSLPPRAPTVPSERTKAIARAAAGGRGHWPNFILIVKNITIKSSCCNSPKQTLLVGLSQSGAGTEGCWGGGEERLLCSLSSWGRSSCKQQLAYCSCHWFHRGRYLAPTNLLSWRFNHIECFCSTCLHAPHLPLTHELANERMFSMAVLILEKLHKPSQRR